MVKTQTPEPQLRSAFDLSAARELFPWPERHRKLGRPLEWLWSRSVGAGAHEIWPLVSDTSRLNRTIGLPRMDYKEIDGALHGAATYWGVPARWTEPPWNWEVNRRLLCSRDYSQGFAKVFRGAVFLEPTGEATTNVHLYFAWIPRGFFWRLFLRRMFPKMEPVYLKALARLDKYVRSEVASFHRAPAVELPDELRGRIAAIRAAMTERGADPESAERWTDYIQSGDPMDLSRIQFPRLARQWRLSERTVLESALIGVEAGLLRVHWDIICPHCRGPRASFDSLAQIPSGLRCDVCRIDFLIEGLGQIDITFEPHPDLRASEPLLYCAAEPARKDHLLAQWRLEPGESVTVSAAWGQGEYVPAINGRDGGSLVVADAPEADSPNEPVWLASRPPHEIRSVPGARLKLVNDLPAETLFTIRRRDFLSDMIQLGEMLTIPAFSRVFGSEALPLNAALDLGERPILFASPSGDEPIEAWRSALDQIVRGFDGVVIRAGASGVQALFNTPASAVGAAAEWLAPGSDPKIAPRRASVGFGPCRAIRTESGRELTGPAVEMASRLLSAAAPGEAVLASAVIKDPAAEAVTRKPEFDLKRGQVDMDDLGAIERVFRLRPRPAGGAPA